MVDRSIGSIRFAESTQLIENSISFFYFILFNGFKFNLAAPYKEREVSQNV